MADIYKVILNLLAFTGNKLRTVALCTERTSE